MHVIAGKAVCFKEALSDDFKAYAKSIVDNAQALAKGLTDRGFDLVSGGTDNHLMLVDLRSKNITGKEFEIALDAANITCNKRCKNWYTCRNNKRLKHRRHGCYC